MANIAPPMADKAQMDNTLKAVREATVAQVGAAGTALSVREVADADQDNVELVSSWIPATLKSLVASKKRYLFGVSFTEVASVALMNLAAARKLKSPHSLLHDMVFAIFVAYTVSRDWAQEYQLLPATSILRSFEIEGRVIDRQDPLYQKNSWVNTSKMNSTAVHLLGYMVVEGAKARGVLGKLKDLRGTPFTDRKLETPQGKLISEHASAITAEDKAAVAAFTDQFEVMIDAVDKIFGDTGFNLKEAEDKAEKMRIVEF